MNYNRNMYADGITTGVKYGQPDVGGEENGITG